MAGDMESSQGPTDFLLLWYKKFIRNKELEFSYQNTRGLHWFDEIQQLRVLIAKTRKEIESLKRLRSTWTAI